VAADPGLPAQITATPAEGELADALSANVTPRARWQVEVVIAGPGDRALRGRVLPRRPAERVSLVREISSIQPGTGLALALAGNGRRRRTGAAT
jgi:hypothetical protein